MLQRQQRHLIPTHFYHLINLTANYTRIFKRQQRSLFDFLSYVKERFHQVLDEFHANEPAIQLRKQLKRDISWFGQDVILKFRKNYHPIPTESANGLLTLERMNLPGVVKVIANLDR